jgi:hypothetical protein
MSDRGRRVVASSPSRNEQSFLAYAFSGFELGLRSANARSALPRLRVASGVTRSPHVLLSRNVEV